MAEMSDGERSAVSVATDILTAGSGSLFLIDERERHLHRSIITPLLTSLISARSDCAFVVATHEVGLPLDFPESRVLLRECHFADKSAMTWTETYWSHASPLMRASLRDILGARGKILVRAEGRTTGSLDQPLYTLLFPGFSIVPKGGKATLSAPSETAEGEPATLRGWRLLGLWTVTIAVSERSKSCATMECFASQTGFP